MTSEEAKKLDALGGCLLMLVAFPVFVFARTYVVYLGWGWHLTPLFGWAPPSLGHVWGIMTLGHMAFAPIPDTKKAEDHATVLGTVGAMLGKQLVFLGAGLLILWWMR